MQPVLWLAEIAEGAIRGLWRKRYMGGIIRIATELDARGIAEVVVATWRVVYRGIISDEGLADFSVQEREACWKKRLQKDDPKSLDWTNLVYEAEQGIIGFATYRPCGDEDKDSTLVGELVAIYMLPEYWGQGFGKQMMDEVLDRFKAQGVSEVTLWVIEANSRARRFYECAGFRADGLSKPEVVRRTNVVEVRYVKKIGGQTGIVRS